VWRKSGLETGPFDSAEMVAGFNKNNNVGRSYSEMYRRRSGEGCRGIQRRSSRDPLGVVSRGCHHFYARTRFPATCKGFPNSGHYTFTARSRGTGLMRETWEDRHPKAYKQASSRWRANSSSCESNPKRIGPQLNTGRTTCLIAHWAVGIAMASIALPPPFRRLLLKIRTTPPCAQRLLILSINESRRLFNRGYSCSRM
jgi:hypothetical protein